MLVKTKKFHQKLLADLKKITINKKNPIMIKGSYSVKDFGALITDIDVIQYVSFNSTLIKRLNEILESIHSSDFMFVYMVCGNYRDFVIPWKIDNKGNCIYDPETAQKWFIELKEKNIMKEEDLEKIEKIIFGKKLSIKKLLQIDDIMWPYVGIIWKEDDIKLGYKMFLGRKYDIVDMLKFKGTYVILKIIYKFGKEVVNIDYNLSDKNYIDHLHGMLNQHYKDNTYKIFKSYKWYIDKKDEKTKEEFKKAVDSMQKIIAPLDRIKTIDIIIKNNLLPQTDIDYLIDDVKQFCLKHFDIKYDPKSEKAGNTLTKLSYEKAEKYIAYFYKKITPRHRQEVDLMRIRNEQGKQEFTQEELKERAKKGECPFFNMTYETLEKIYNLAKRMLIEPKLMVDCFEKISILFDIDINILLNSFWNRKSLKKDGEELILYDGMKEINRYHFSKLKKIQMKVLIGKI